MADRLQIVVGEMGTAFNTTTIALAAAITMMFSMFVCERIDRGIVRSIDRLTERELLHRFEMHDPQVMPFLSAIRSGHEECMRAVTGTLQRLIGVWTQTLENLFQRFDARQQHELQGWQQVMQVLQQRHETHDAGREERLRQTLAILDARQDEHNKAIQTMLVQVLSLKDDLSKYVN